MKTKTTIAVFAAITFLLTTTAIPIASQSAANGHRLAVSMSKIAGPADIPSGDELIYGMTSDTVGGNRGLNLVSFNSNSPGTITNIGPFTGVVAGQVMRSMDFRPATGELYAISTATQAGGGAQLYTVNLANAALTPVGAGFILTSTPGTEMDFNPVADRIRILTASTVASGLNNNFRVNPNDGTLVATDTNLAFDASDPQSGNMNFTMSAGAYSNNVAGATQTTLYAWEIQLDSLVTVGGVNGVPSPNTGLMFTVNTPPAFLTFNFGMGMDISGATGTLYATHDDPETGTVMNLYTRDLATGVEALVGAYPAGVFVIDLSVFPASSGVISGTVTYGNAIPAATRFVSNVLISGTGSPNVSAVTGAGTGQYSLAGFGAGSYTVTPSKSGGAANGAISSFDAARVAQHASGLNPLTGNALIVADVSGGGGVTSFDAGLVARFAAGLAPPPANLSGSWIFVPASRNYAAVTSSISGEDYSALLMGEVSGNWTDNGTRPRNSGGPERSAAVTAPKLVASAGDEVVIPVRVARAANKGIIAYEFDLRYDPSVLQPQQNAVELAETVSHELTAVANAEEPGLLRVVVYGVVPIQGNGVLLNLRFNAVGASGSVSPLSFENLIFNEGNQPTVAIDGEVKLSTNASSEAESERPGHLFGM